MPGARLGRGARFARRAGFGAGKIYPTAGGGIGGGSPEAGLVAGERTEGISRRAPWIAVMA
jgi:hypothetical protein